MRSVEQTVNPVVTFGGASPERILSNQEYIDEYFTPNGIVSTPYDIESRTGIQYRRFAGPDKEPGSQLVNLAVAAGRHVLDLANVSADKVVSIDMATTTPPRESPNMAVTVSRLLDVGEYSASLDIRAACAGMVAGLRNACANLLMEGDDGTALVIGANLLSRTADHTDKRSGILFGDGAGAAAVTLKSDAIRPVFRMMSQPNEEAIKVGESGRIEMNGKVVRQHAVDIMTRSALAAAEAAGMLTSAGKIDMKKVDYLVPHQANLRIMEEVAAIHGVPLEQVIVGVDKYGNTSSASIPLAVAEAQANGPLLPGRHTILTPVVGAGMVGGSGLFQIDVPGLSPDAMRLPLVA